MTDTTNLKLWDSLKTTPAKYTKEFKRGGGFSGTAINATYIIQKLTETFGPCGTGWRFVLEDEQIVEGHTLKTGDKAKLHIVRGHLDYRAGVLFAVNGVDIGNGWCSTSPQFGQTMLVDENKNGVFMDEEAPKKSITDCIGKCAVLLGIGADVHLGMYDDNKYVNERKKDDTSAMPSAKSDDPREKARALWKEIAEQVAGANSEADLDKLVAERQADLEEIKKQSAPGHKDLMDKIAARRSALDMPNDPLP